MLFRFQLCFFLMVSVCSYHASSIASLETLADSYPIDPYPANVCHVLQPNLTCILFFSSHIIVNCVADARLDLMQYRERVTAGAPDGCGNLTQVLM